jgi:citrate synthase
MGQHSFVDVMLLQITGQMPSVEMRTMLDAILVSISDHGLMPSVLAARMTLLGAPEALQGAVAAGLLGAGNRYLGTSQLTAEMLQRQIAGRTDWSDEAIATQAQAVVDECTAEKKIVSGLGHPIHTDGDPRTVRLFEIARETGFYGPHCRLLEAVQKLMCERRGKYIPLNAAGAVGAVVSDMGFKPFMARAFPLIARVPGLVAHLAEEFERPIAHQAWELIMRESGGVGASGTTPTTPGA